MPTWRFCGLQTHIFKSHNSKIWHESANLGLPPQAKFCKNRLRRYTPFGQIYIKNAILGDVGPHFAAPYKLSYYYFYYQNGEIWRTWDSLPQAQFCEKNRLTGIPLLGKSILKVTNFGDFGGCKQHFKNDNSELWREGTDLIVGYIILLVRRCISSLLLSVLADTT